MRLMLHANSGGKILSNAKDSKGKYIGHRTRLECACARPHSSKNPLVCNDGLDSLFEAPTPVQRPQQRTRDLSLKDQGCPWKLSITQVCVDGVLQDAASVSAVAREHTCLRNYDTVRVIRQRQGSVLHPRLLEALVAAIEMNPTNAQMRSWMARWGVE
jgi:hypothetical protein